MTAIPVREEDATPGYNYKIPEKILTPDRVETRLGTLEFVDGMPTEATVAAVYDNLDQLRGIEVFLNGSLLLPSLACAPASPRWASMRATRFSSLTSRWIPLRSS